MENTGNPVGKNNNDFHSEKGVIFMELLAETCIPDRRHHVDKLPEMDDAELAGSRKHEPVKRTETDVLVQRSASAA